MHGDTLPPRRFGVFRVWEGDSMTRAGAGAETSQVLRLVCLASPATMAMTPCSLFLSTCIVQFLSKKKSLCVLGTLRLAAKTTRPM